MPIDSSNELFYAYKAIKLLTKPFEEWPAYEKGIIDDKGERQISHWSSLQKDDYNTYNIFIRFMAIIKQHLEHVPAQKKLQFKKRLIFKSLREHLEVSSSKEDVRMFLIDLKENIEKIPEQETDSTLNEAIFSEIFSVSEDHCEIGELEKVIEEIEKDLEESMSAGAGPVGIAGVNDAQSSPSTDTVVPSRLKRSRRSKKDDEEEKSVEKKSKKDKRKSFRNLISKL